MSNKINFNEVEVGGSNNNTRAPRKTLSPGVYVLNIEEVEAKENTNGKPFLGIKFTNEEGQYVKEQFYATTANAFKRIKELATNAGVELGEDTLEEVAAKLIGNKVGLKLGGEKTNEIIEGTERAVTRAGINLAYNFSFKPADFEKNKDFKVTVDDKTAPIAGPGEGLDLPKEDNDDLPF